MARDGLWHCRSTSAPQAGGGCLLKPGSRCDKAIPTGVDLPEIGQLRPTHRDHASHQQLLRDPDSNVFFDADQHHLPHVHAVYQGAQAQFDIDNGEVLAGNLPRAQTRLVQAWLEIRRDELTTAWSLAVTGQRPEPVQPLR